MGPQPPPKLQRPPSMQQPHNMHQMPFSLLNPFIVQPAMFNTPEQYERFLTLQEEQIRIAREQIELQKSLNLSNFNPLLLQSPVSPYQQTGLLMPFQAAAATTIAAPLTPPSSPTKPVFSSFPSQVQQSQAPPPEVSITEAVQRINRQPSHHPLSSNNNNTVTAPTSTLLKHSGSDSSQPTQVNPSPIHHPPSEPTEKVKKRATPVVVVDESSTPQIREMIEHEAINKRGALAMFKALESNQPVPQPVYQTQSTKSFLKPKTTTTTKPKPTPAPVEPPKSILKQRPQETQQAQATPHPAKQQQQQLVKPNVLKESENQRGDLDDCRNVSVSNIKSQWGTVASAPAPPPQVIIDEEEDEIVEESNNNDDFDLMVAHEEPVLTSFKPRPEDFQREKITIWSPYNR